MSADSETKPIAQNLRGRFKEAVSESILQAAEDVFAEHGPDGAHVNEIAQRAGVSVGTLYNYFKDRENLLAALLGSRRDELLARLDGVLVEQAAQPFRAQLGAFLTALLEHFETHRRFLSILLLSRHEGHETIAKSGGPFATMTEIYARMEDLMRRGLDQAALRAEDAPLYPALLMGMVRGVFMRLAFNGLEVNPTATADRLVTFFLEGAGVRT